MDMKEEGKYLNISLGKLSYPIDPNKEYQLRLELQFPNESIRKGKKGKPSKKIY